ncbi:MAG: FimB/Mfa2 family fimbrial subunit, partial [Muribaculaceae bacterium]|nr:FimB/Mfa2 family fimbrial subunit [Muribaculaceae bacterium]
EPGVVGDDDNLATIVIRNTYNNRDIVNEPLIQKLLLASKPKVMAPDGEHWTTKSDQEYLDREDTYEAIFTLEDYAHIIVHINGWRVIINNVVIGQ